MAGPVVHRAPPFGVGVIMISLLFGTNFFLFAFFQIVKLFSKSSVESAPAVSSSSSSPSSSSSSSSAGLELTVSDGKTKKAITASGAGAAHAHASKELSKPFVGSVECYINLTAELFRLGLILGMTYVCEYLWVFEHSTKSYSRDLFMFVLILFFAYAYYTVKPITDLSLLGREQTEEWKGWMQFIFLLYHYFHAEEVYNSVRVMITCYVWMTGFGNFSFFYTKQDFSWLRIVQMLWRLNFSVLLLMWTHENTYILYYICPMHTFYFLMVYATMYCFSYLNQTKWAIRWKLLILAIIIYLVWDINNGLFDFLFAWLGTDKVIGAGSGSVWEYYFRTSLDHWSTLFGMIFALNFPLAEQYFVKARGMPLIVASVLMGIVTVLWVYYIFPLDKLAYNLVHSYYAIIPLTSYIFFRNITPGVRSVVSMSLHDLGKTTLETYLLQHHIWLSSNAKTLWTLIPDRPWINFAICTMIFFAVSKELYRLTMSIRGMLIPDDKNIAWNNILWLIVLFFVLGLLANVMIAFNPTIPEIIIACEALCIVALLLVGRYTNNMIDHNIFQHYASKFMKWMGILFGVSLLLQLIYGSSDTVQLNTNHGNAVVYRGNSKECLNSISHGRWAIEPCADAPSGAKVAYCSKNVWTWTDVKPDCPIAHLSTGKAQALFKNKKILFIGDSLVRSSYHQLVTLIEPSYYNNHSMVMRQPDMAYSGAFGTKVYFKWGAFIQNVTTILSNLEDKPDILVAGSALWDALHVHDLASYSKGVNDLNGVLQNKFSGNSTFKVWMLPTIITDGRLSTEEKRLYMNEKIVQDYRKVSSSVFAADVILDTLPASVLRETTSTDGVHYADEVYAVISQMIANTYSLQNPRNYGPKPPKPYTPKVTGSMSDPYLGAAVLGLIFVMLFFMDSFLGIGYLSLLLFGRFYDWETGYGSLHAKLSRGSNHSSNNKQPNHDSIDEDSKLLKEQRGGDNSA